MKRSIKESYDDIKLGGEKKESMLGGILAEYEAVRDKRRERLLRRGIAACAACALIGAVIAVIFLTNAEKERNAYIPGAAQSSNAAAVSGSELIAYRVKLSINPSVEFQIGEDGMIVAVVGLNEDGAALIEGIDFAGLSMENATIIVVNRLIEQGYINASMVDDVYISVSGSPQQGTLAMMSAIIKTAASGYEIAVDTVQTNENELQVVMGEADPPGSSESPEPSETPSGQPSEIPSETPTETPSESSSETPTESPSETPSETPQAEKKPQAVSIKLTKEMGAVGRVYITFEDGETITNYLDFAGMRVNEATFWAISNLTDDGYMTGSKQGSELKLDVSGFGTDIVSQVYELVSLMIEEAGTPFEISQTSKSIILTATGAPIPERTAKYTLMQIWDPTIHKSKEDITELQMRILSMVYSGDIIEEILTPRYWAVVPNVLGLPEDKAAELMELAGFVIDVNYTGSTQYSEAEYGTVVFQDFSAGCLLEVGDRMFIEVKSEDVPQTENYEEKFPPDTAMYFPSFLDDTGTTEVSLVAIPSGGKGIPFKLKEGWEAELRPRTGIVVDKNGAESGSLRFVNDPNSDTVYWTFGSDIPAAADLLYFVYEDGTAIKSAVIRLEFAKNDGSAIIYNARLLAFREDGSDDFDELYDEGPQK